MVLLSFGGVLAASVPFLGDTLQQRIDDCARAGGDEVVVSAGVHAFKPFGLKSGVTLRLEKGAVMQASINIVDYPVREGAPVLIGAYDVHDVAIVGESVIDGQGGAFAEKGISSGRESTECRSDDGALSAWGLYVRHASELKLEDMGLRLKPRANDARARIVRQ